MHLILYLPVILNAWIMENRNKWSHYDCIETFQNFLYIHTCHAIWIFQLKGRKTKISKKKNNNNKLIYIAHMKKLL